MEFIVSHKHFTQALSEVSKAISTKVLIPILSGIKITADQSGITLIASNSNVFIKNLYLIQSKTNRLQLYYKQELLLYLQNISLKL